jgi:protein TonB
VSKLDNEPATVSRPPPVSTDNGVTVQQPPMRSDKIPAAPPTIAAVEPSARHNKADEDAAARAYATQLARLIGKNVSRRDYPRIAQDRRWEGTTQLVVRFHAGGRLSEVTVASSSGYDVLDQRAVELVNHITLPAVPAAIESRAFAVRIPVSFTLREQ